MDRYRLVKLVEWADQLRTRKRLQKVVYLLKAGGCPFDVDFTLHHYGPYSHELAQLVDEMVGVDLLKEEAEPNMMAGRSFWYRLSESAREQLAQLNQEADRLEGIDEFDRFESLAKQLLKEPSLKRLEYGATVAYFRKQGKSWEEAQQAAAKFKNQDPGSITMREAEKLAREVLAEGAAG